MDGWDDDQDVRTDDCAVAVLSTHKRGLTIIVLVGAVEELRTDAALPERTARDDTGKGENRTNQGFLRIDVYAFREHRFSGLIGLGFRVSYRQVVVFPR